MFEREDVLSNALMECIKEMFAKAQPAADFDNLIEEKKAGKIDEDKDGPVYNRHYLSMDEFTYILDKYMKAYRINAEWKEDVDIIKGYLENGGSKDKYIESYTDEDGNFHSARRGYEPVAPLKEQIFKYLCNSHDEHISQDLTDGVYNLVMSAINDCKNFYNFNADEMKFRNTLMMWATPTSNKETVKKWWKEHYDVDIEIEDRNPLLFWEYDYYGDNIDEVMKEEYGDNWEEYWWNKYKLQEEKKKAEIEEKIKALKKEQDSNEQDSNN